MVKGDANIITSYPSPETILDPVSRF